MALNKKDEQENQRNQPRRGDGKRQPVHRLWETKEKDRQLGRAERSNKNINSLIISRDSGECNGKSNI